MVRQKWRREDLAKDSFCVMRNTESKVKSKLWMVVGVNVRLYELPIERRKLKSRKELLQCTISTLEGLSLRNIESFQEIILSIQRNIRDGGG